MTLSVSNLSVSYGKRTVLHDVNFDSLKPGQLTALLGPNAAGKSTLFRSISGLLKPDNGTFWLGGSDLGDLSKRERLKKICFMPQFFASNAALTVFDVVMMAHKQLIGWKVTANDVDIVASAISSAGIGHLSEAYISELSGGQSQMVTVAQALIRKADVYLFDEPTSALDLRHQLEVLGRIKDAMKERNAVGVVALHDLNLASRFADHLLLIGQGKVLAQGAPEQVLADPVLANTYDVEIDLSIGPRKDLRVHAYPT